MNRVPPGGWIDKHWVLFGVLPVLHVLGSNAAKIHLGDLVLPVLLGVAVACALRYVTARVTGSGETASVLTSWILIGAFDYRPFRDGIVSFLCGFVGLSLLHGAVVAMVVFVTVFIAGCVWIVRAGDEARVAHRILGAIGAVLLASSLAEYGMTVRDTPSLEIALPRPSYAPGPGSSNVEVPPDVYFVVPDTYPRADFLASRLSIDNRPFISELSRRGFQIPDRALSSYPVTRLAIPSTLAMNYWDLDVLRRSGTDNLPIDTDPPLVQFFAGRGYSIHVISSVGEHVRGARSPGVWARSWHGTLLGALFAQTIFGSLARQFGLDGLRRDNLAVLDELDAVVDAPGPKFVFAHVLCPHFPIVFGPEGEPVSTWKTGLAALFDRTDRGLDGHTGPLRGQIGYLNRRLLEFVDRAIRKSDGRAVIVLQGDHGFKFFGDTASPSQDQIQELFGVFCAIRVPGLEVGSVPRELGGANSWRFVLSRRFSVALPPLPVRHFWLAPGSKPIEIDASGTAPPPFPERR